MAVVYNKYSFCRIRILTPFCTQTNLRENRLFAVGWAFGGKNVSYNVKIYAEKVTWVRADELTRGGKVTS